MTAVIGTVDTSVPIRGHPDAERQRYGLSLKRSMEGRVVRHRLHRWRVHQAFRAVPQLDYERRIERLSGRSGALPPVCLACLPLGAPDADLPGPQESRTSDFDFRGQPAHVSARLGLQPGPARSALRPRILASTVYERRFGLYRS